MTLTPEQFNYLANKDDLNELESKIRSDMATKEDVDKILSAIDSFAKKTEDAEIEQTANIGAHDRFEKRLTNLESPAVA